VIELQPDNAQALNYLGYMLADRNVKLDEASQLVQKALKMEPENGAFLDSMGWIYYRQGKYSEAQGLLERALAQTPDPTIHDHLGDVLAKMGRTKEAASEWQASLKLARQPGADSDEDEMATVTKKLDEAQAKLAREAH
ncbi:MAG TPA: tetratricopeptide repeat protein, partial [Verrucomicrobiae bacterium]|nr:tetratricopeptide repeat protein [Verrucomicrobiae bacterium]